MSNTGRTVRHGRDGGQGSQEPSATRDKLAVRLSRLEAAAPEALDVLAVGLDAAAGELRGVAGQVAGPRGPDHFRRVLRGEEAGIAAEICRLAIDGRREPRLAVCAFLTAIANAAGYTLEPLPATTAAEIHEAVAARRVADAALDAEIIRDLADGQLSAVEATNLEPELAAAKAQLAKVEAAIAQAKARALGKPVSTEGGR